MRPTGTGDEGGKSGSTREKSIHVQRKGEKWTADIDIPGEEGGVNGRIQLKGVKKNSVQGGRITYRKEFERVNTREGWKRHKNSGKPVRNRSGGTQATSIKTRGDVWRKRNGSTPPKECKEGEPRN